MLRNQYWNEVDFRAPPDAAGGRRGDCRGFRMAHSAALECVGG
jgi:hypothetical protein